VILFQFFNVQQRMKENSEFKQLLKMMFIPRTLCAARSKPVRHRSGGILRFQIRGEWWGWVGVRFSKDIFSLGGPWALLPESLRKIWFWNTFLCRVREVFVFFRTKNNFSDLLSPLRREKRSQNRNLMGTNDTRDLITRRLSVSTKVNYFRWSRRHAGWW
jgi:hypothetical protein